MGIISWIILGLIAGFIGGKIVDKRGQGFWLNMVVGIVGALIGMGIPEYEAKRYEGRIQKGGILLSVHCDTSDEIKRAKEIMNNTGAEDISSTGESSSDYPAGEPQVRRTSSGSAS